MNALTVVMLAFSVLGAIDRIIGNKFGLGKEFENGILAMGSLAMAMIGIICLAPVLSSVLGFLITPLCSLLHMDPGIFGSILAIDMGGYQLSLDLARDPAIGMYSAVVVSSIFGCTIVYNIPVGLGFIGEEDRPHFTRGILLGLTAMPFAIVIISGRIPYHWWAKNLPVRP